MNTERIAVVGIGLRYPDADSPDQLWDNVLARRRAFRRLPDERLNHADYWSADPSAPDRLYSATAAVLRDFEFDRARFKVAGSTFRVTDMTHWLALDVASRALADAGFPDGEGLPNESTGVFVGNSLTGEFVRANMMRLRWPYVRRTVAAALAGKGWGDGESADFLRELEAAYKAPFPPTDEDSLAGGLSNTIAGRVCNHFDLRGGGYTVDGACSSSLLSVVTAANALTKGTLDVAVAGGVDLSLDPFELVGFAKTGALATGEMKVYDRDSNGFWPGEGCGMVVLMRESEALRRGLRVYAVIPGWGVSSDGKGGITRPEAGGHRLAMARAYALAGYGVESVSYFEGHGTGTAVGDATEIEALSSARRAADPDARPAALSSIKGNIGHTKAAAGVAGLIKAVMAVHHQVIPPGTGHDNPHPRLLDGDAALYVPRTAELWPADRPVRAGVSALGFGGINTHITVEQAAAVRRRTALDDRTREVVAGGQNAEVLLLDALDAEELGHEAERLAAVAAKLAQAELGDLAGALASRLSGGALRAAVVVTSARDAERALTRLAELCAEGRTRALLPEEGVFLGRPTDDPKLVFAFPGQGSHRPEPGAFRRRFPAAFAGREAPVQGDHVATEVAQPRIVAGSLAALEVLRELGVDATAAVGHSLGELTALHWGGALAADRVLALAAVRGRVMAEASRGGGAMASLTTGPERARRLIGGEEVVIAGYNGPSQTVVSGPADAVRRVCAAAEADGVTAVRIAVSHAFHSDLVAPAAAAMVGHLAEFDFDRPQRTVVSTVTGDVLDPDADLRDLLREQIVGAVRFHEAAARAADGADLVVEVGPGRVLSGLLAEVAPDVPALSTDVDSRSLAPFLQVVGAAFALGAPLRTDVLFAGRALRPFPLDGGMTFLASPCEAAPALDTGRAEEFAPAPIAEAVVAEGSTLDLLRDRVAERVELPVASIGADTHPMDDLHLSSITIGQIVNEVARSRGQAALATAPNFATVRLGELAGMLDALAETGREEESRGAVPGVAAWVRAFSVDHVDAGPLPAAPAAGRSGAWAVYAPPDHPLAQPLHAALAGAGIGDGVLLCLPERGDGHDDLILAAGKAAAAAGGRFVVVEQRLGAAGLAKTLHLEHPEVTTTVVRLADVMPADPVAAGVAVRRVVAEAAATTGFAEVRYDESGARTTPRLRALPVHAEDGAAQAALGPDDVLLVAGGGKGITAECALALAKDSGAALALLGRDDPADHPELAANLARMDLAGVRYRYLRVDVTRPEAVRDVVARVGAELGPVTAVLYGAGRNEPTGLAALTPDELRRTLAPKVTGLRAVLDAVDAERLRLLITFGSVIGRAGLRGEAHYATANDWATELTLDHGRAHPHTRVLALEWSVWSGAGMGERLGVVEALIREGITPISVEEGLTVLRRVLADPAAGPVLVISGRAGDLPTLALERRELPLKRFLDRVLVHYPGVELVTEADLSASGDLYLADHELDGDLLFPAVFGMEAMAQVGSALVAADGPPVLEDVEFPRPIVVRPGGQTTVRVAALVREAGVVDVVLRSEETGFAADHFRARLRFPRPGLTGGEPVPDLPAVPVDPHTALYGGMLFQGKRFQRLQAYRKVSARHAVAELSTTAPGPWFAAFLPQALELADPGVRDAVMHSLQCCVPDATLLPRGIEALHLAAPSDLDTGHVVVDARERSQDGDSYTYDIDVRTPAGELVERWQGLTLRAVRRGSGSGPWVPAMLGPHLERALEDVLGRRLAVVVEPGTSGRGGGGTEVALSRALGRPAGVRYRPDGKPEVAGAQVSAAHTGGLTFAVVGGGRLGCDAESAVERSAEDWAALLGRDQEAVRDLVAAETGEPATVAATRVWSALECLRKTGATTQALTVTDVRPGGWVVLSAGNALVATWATTVAGQAGPTVFAVLVGEGS
uniref:Polyketide synthase n=1 Tax=Streptoalloteichus sp. ATCC 53650 TaxID=756733 RepID=K4NYS5_9PSEU|nr:polyketide synthase [Streptoalloteichus sp. ATCC 53650]